VTVRVVTAAEASATDRRAIDAGIPARALMQRAGAAAASEIVLRYPRAIRRGVAIYSGPGNNGGDGWVVAGALAAAGIPARVRQCGELRSDDARAERAHALSTVPDEEPHGDEEIIVDALLGTGASGTPRGAIAAGIAEMMQRRAHGARIVSLDIPSGLDATSGFVDAGVVADLTLTFGTVKRGHLIARGHCGRLVVLDIGLGAHGDYEQMPALIGPGWVRERVPPIHADAHKGVRRKLAIVGGGEGMAGAAILAARAAMRSGIGIARLIVAKSNMMTVQTAAYEALGLPWPETDDDVQENIVRWGHGVLLGPGLGNYRHTRALAERVLRVWRGPVVVDADALNVFAGDVNALRDLLRGRPALITPHPAEFARLAGCLPDEVLEHRFEIGVSLARTLGCTVLLKGVPTVITDPDGQVLVSASGTPVLAAAGSGDVLAGIVATLLTQTEDAFIAAGCAAVVHGRAGEIANRHRAVRGLELGAVLDALPTVWGERLPPRRPPLLAELERPGDRMR
jgi:ADP-dependent NAD(P)H-hydrate dehydratase / NAD(P)H-hydrate epimerase